MWRWWKTYWGVKANSVTIMLLAVFQECFLVFFYLNFVNQDTNPSLHRSHWCLVVQFVFIVVWLLFFRFVFFYQPKNPLGSQGILATEENQKFIDTQCFGKWYLEYVCTLILRAYVSSLTWLGSFSRMFKSLWVTIARNTFFLCCLASQRSYPFFSHARCVFVQSVISR